MINVPIADYIKIRYWCEAVRPSSSTPAFVGIVSRQAFLVTSFRLREHICSSAPIDYEESCGVRWLWKFRG